MRLKDLVGWVIIALICRCHLPTGAAIALVVLYWSVEDKKDE